MKIGVIGACGIVGSAISEGFQRLGHEVVKHDIKLNTSISVVHGCDIVFISVPSNMRNDGSCDTTIVEEVVADLMRMETKDFNGVIAIKSTVTPGTSERLGRQYSTYGGFNHRICFVPEFLRERSAFFDFTEGHDNLVVGTHSDAVFEKVVKAHGHYPKTTTKLSPTEAELSKYFSNVYNAMRITFANGFYDICKSLDADYTSVKNAIAKRGTIKDMYLDCNENFRGFGGYCLPKDSAALAHLAKQLGVKANIFSTIVEDNKIYKTTVFKGMRL